MRTTYLPISIVLAPVDEWCYILHCSDSAIGNLYSEEKKGRITMEMGIPLAMVRAAPLGALLFIFVGFLVLILVVAALVLAIIALIRTSKNRREIDDLNNKLQSK